MISKNLKTILFGTLLASSMLRAAENNTILPIDDTLPPIKSTSSNLSSDENFAKLIQKLNYLTVSNGKLDPWKEAILEFQSSLPEGSKAATLESIRERVFGADLAKRRLAMASRAFSSLHNPQTSTEIISNTPASSPVISRLPKGARSPLPPIGLIILQNMPLSEKSTLSSGKRQRLTLSQSDEKRLSPIEEHQILVGRKAISMPDISNYLKRFIAGQDAALDELSFFAHRFLCNKLLIECGQPAANIPTHCILTGPTGCGKSETLKRLSLFLNVPVLYINARSLTDEGFKGKNFSECVAEFCGNIIPESAIVVLDEIDKLSRKESNENEMKSFGRSMQQVLLAPLDGSPIMLKDKQIPLKNWWFIGTGAFSNLKGIHDTKKERPTTARTQRDIINAGFDPEFVGRFPSIIAYKEHSLETMIDVISKEGSPLQKTLNEFRLYYGVNLIIEESALRQLALTSIEINLGVRSLNSILNPALRPFYQAASTLSAPEGNEATSMTVTLQDIMPAIRQFKEDNKEIKKDPFEGMSEEVRRMWI